MTTISPELSAAINAVTDGTCTQAQAHVLLEQLRTDARTIAALRKRQEIHDHHNVLCPDHRDKQTECPACKVETLTRLLKEARGER
jgi:hypothetical protein